MERRYPQARLALQLAKAVCSIDQMSESKLMSKAAHDALVAEIERLETVDRAAIAERINAARALGDLSENAEYHAAKNDQSFLETRILSLRDQLSHAQIVESSDNDDADAVAFGSTVRLLNTSTGKEATYTIVSSFEQDVSQGRLSASSPVASAVIGAKRDQVVKVDLPNGSTSEFKVVEIS
jgi:transcription elongation factor GreA